MEKLISKETLTSVDNCPVIYALAIQHSDGSLTLIDKGRRNPFYISYGKCKEAFLSSPHNNIVIVKLTIDWAYYQKSPNQDFIEV